MSDQDPRSSFVIELAWPTWGIPLLLTYPLVCFLEPFDRLLGSPMVSRGGDPIFGGFSKSRLGKRRAACVWWCLGSYTHRAVVLDVR